MASTSFLGRCFGLALFVIATAAAARAPVGNAWSWAPELAPSGPLVAIVSLPRQQLTVYRNGVRIGVSPVSSGRAGHDTPVGVFTILQKEVEHHSNLYDDAPMPFMQRLTWDGVALHAGTLPGYPASHGCIRLPDAFARRLYEATRPGDVVVVVGRDSVPSTLAAPGVLAAVDARNGAAVPPPDATATVWAPDASPAGPLSIVVSTHDRMIAVTRNGVRIGSAPIDVSASVRIGTRAYVMLDGVEPQPSAVLPDRPARRWMSIGVAGDAAADAALRDAIATGLIAFPVEFARDVYDALAPGTTVIVTDEPLGGPAEAPLVIEGTRQR